MILVTGGLGYIGSHTVVELIKNNVTERQFIEYSGKIRHIN